MRILVLSVVLIFAALAGCFSDDTRDGPDEAGTTTPGDDAAGGDTNLSGGGDMPPMTEPVVKTLYLGPDLTLVEAVPEAGSYAQGEFISDYYMGTIDAEAYTLRSDPLAGAALIHALPVTIALWIETDTPQVSYPGTTESGAAAFFGSTKGLPLFGLEFGPLVPGAPAEFTFDLAFADMRPIVVPTGESVALFAGVFATTTDQAPARILYGGEYPSAVTFTMSNLTEDPLRAAAAPSEESFPGSLQKHGDPPARHEFTVEANASYVEVFVEKTGGHVADLDMDLLDAGGTVLTGSHTPATLERMFLAGPALDGLRGATLAVQVSHYYSAQATYQLTVTQG